MRLQASTTLTDQRRALRLLAAWAVGDKLALDVVLDEVVGDPTGTPGLLFALTEFTTDLGERLDGDYVDRLRATLLKAEGNQ